MDLPIFPRFISVFLAASLALPLSGSSLVLVSGEQASAADLAVIAAQPLGEGEAFRPVSAAALNSAASRLRLALTPLDSLLARSPSGANWKAYLDWPALTAQAAAGKNADFATLRRLRDLLNAEESGLEMHQFAATRRAVSAYTEAAEAAQMPEAPALYKTRLEKIAAALAVGAAAGTTDALQPLGPLLAKLEESSLRRPWPACAAPSTDPISISMSTKRYSPQLSIGRSIRQQRLTMSCSAPAFVAWATQRVLCYSI